MLVSKDSNYQTQLFFYNKNPNDGSSTNEKFLYESAYGINGYIVSALKLKNNQIFIV